MMLGLARGRKKERNSTVTICSRKSDHGGSKLHLVSWTCFIICWHRCRQKAYFLHNTFPTLKLVIYTVINKKKDSKREQN